MGETVTPWWDILRGVALVIEYRREHFAMREAERQVTSFRRRRADVLARMAATGWSTREIAGLVGLPASTVGRKVATARRRLLT